MSEICNILSLNDFRAFPCESVFLLQLAVIARRNRVHFAYDTVPLFISIEENLC